MITYQSITVYKYLYQISSVIFQKKVKGGSKKNLHLLTDIVYNQSFFFFIYLEYMCTGTLLYLNTS